MGNNTVLNKSNNNIPKFIELDKDEIFNEFENDEKRLNTKIKISFSLKNPVAGKYIIQILQRDKYNDNPIHLLIFSTIISDIEIKVNSEFKFEKDVITNFLFECDQKIILNISYFEDKNEKNLDKRKFIKKIVSISSILGSGNHKIEIPLKEKFLSELNNSIIVLFLEEIEKCKYQVLINTKTSLNLGMGRYKFVLKKLVTKKILDEENKVKKIDYFKTLYSSEIINLTVEKEKDSREISMDYLDFCDGDLNTKLLIQMINEEKLELEGEKHFCLADLNLTKIKNSDQEANLCIHFMNKKSKSKSDLSLDVKFKIIEKLTFIDYLKKGMQIALVIGIDFSASNKNYHQISNKLNDYEKAIKYCGQILAYYDSDQVYPVFGFGAKVLNSKITDHCFHVNLNKDPFINKISNVIKCYRRCLSHIKPDGPTNLSYILDKTIDDTKRKMKKSNNDKENINLEYTVLLLLTDGQISDMEKSVESIITASNYPISVVIIGIGDGNFKDMDALDADLEPLVDKYGRIMQRDIVQFVEFNKYTDDVELLIKEVLREIPKQVEDYFALKFINNMN